MAKRKEIEVLAFHPGNSCGGWQIVIWSTIENLSGKYHAPGILIQTIDRSESWVFDDMGKAFKFCFDTGKVPVDENGKWNDSGDLMFGDDEAVPIIAWRRLWKKEVGGTPDFPEYEYQSPDWPVR